LEGISKIMDREKYIIEKYGIDTTLPAPYFCRINRWKQLPYLLAELGCKVGAEIGVEQGKFSDCLLRKIPDLKMYCIDCWEAYKGYREPDKKKYAGWYQRAIDLLTPYGEKAIMIKKYSMDAVKLFPDESLDFVYIDGNHDFKNCTMDIAEWSKKVKVGGIIAGHDFTRVILDVERIDVEDVVRAWTKANDIDIWFVTDEGEHYPSFFWVKK
jgi:hypothetical protein